MRTPPLAAGFVWTDMRKNIRVTTALSAILALFVVLFALAAAAGISVLRENRTDIEALGRGSIERAGDLPT